MQVKVGSLQGASHVPSAPKAVVVRKRALPALSSRAFADVVTATALMAVGGLVIGEAIRLGFGWTADGPRSGFFPFWLGTILVLCSVANIVKAVRQASQKQFVTGEQLHRVLTVLLPAVGMILVTQVLGLYVASALYMAFCMRWLGRHSWSASLALPAAISAVIFVIFERWFLVPLPKGPLEAWLGY